MKDKKSKGQGFNIHLDEEDRKVVDELIQNNVNVSSAFKMFIRIYLSKIKNVNVNLNL